MPQNNNEKLYVAIISSKKEKDELFKLCKKYNVPIQYPELFRDKKVYPLWGISKSGVGLVGTIIARFTKKDHILHTTKEIKKIFATF